MKAIVITGPNLLEYKEVPKPKIYVDEILVKVKAVGLCKTDIEVLEGKHPYTQKIFADSKMDFNLIPGHEWSGIVEEVGTECEGFFKGEHVIGETTINCGKCDYCKNGMPNLCENVQEIGITRDGAMAEFLSVPCKFLHKIPNNIPFQEAAMIEPTAVAVHAMNRLLNEISIENFKKTKILIFGDGPIALLCLQVLKLKNPEIIIVVGKSEKKLKIAKKLGSDSIINTYNLNEEESVAHIQNELGEKKVDVIIDATSNFAYADSAVVEGLNLIKKQGIFLLLGMHKPTKIPINNIVLNEIKIIGAVSSPGTWEESINMLTNKKIKFKPMITIITSLEEVPNLIKKTAISPDEIVKAIINI